MSRNPVLSGLASRHDLVGYGAVAVGLAVLALPTLYDLATKVWNTDEQGHGPIVLGVALWLLLKNWAAMLGARSAPSPMGWPVLVLGLLAYLVGRSQQILLFEAGSLIALLSGTGLLLFGGRAMRVQWFAFFFLAFMVPLPGVVVETLTMPMKMLVSYVAEQVMHAMGYPVSRSGVILYVGQYQLLVADACAGLHTLFTLEALGLLYLNIVRRHSLVRNVILALLIVPISFAANSIRVIALSLITYYFGDEAGQGFLHGFAGMVLFLSALMLIIAVDSLLHMGLGVRKDDPPAQAGLA
jgi:exosortase B